MNGNNTDNERGLLPYPVILAATKGDPDAMKLEYIQNGNRRLIADAAIWDWYHRAKTAAKPPAGQGG